MATASDVIDGIVHDVLFGVVLKAVVDKIIVAVPFLAWPVINPVFMFILTQFVTLFYNEMEKVVNFSIIDIQIGIQKQEYDNAVNQIQGVLAKPQATPEEIEKAKNDFKNSLSTIVHMPH